MTIEIHQIRPSVWISSAAVYLTKSTETWSLHLLTTGLSNLHLQPPSHFLDNLIKETSKYCLSSEENLRAALNKMGVANKALEDVMDKVKNRHYQVIVCYQNLLLCFPLYALLLGASNDFEFCHAVGMYLNIWSCSRGILWSGNQSSESVLQRQQSKFGIKGNNTFKECLISLNKWYKI